MRAENIEVTLKIPFKETDLNGVRYSESAIKKACEGAKRIPIDIIDDDEEIVLLGIANEIGYDEDDKCILVKGVLDNGGTSEKIRQYGGTVTDMVLRAIGLN